MPAQLHASVLTDSEGHDYSPCRELDGLGSIFIFTFCYLYLRDKWAIAALHSLQGSQWLIQHRGAECMEIEEGVKIH